MSFNQGNFSDCEFGLYLCSRDGLNIIPSPIIDTALSKNIYQYKNGLKKQIHKAGCHSELEIGFIIW